MKASMFSNIRNNPNITDYKEGEWGWSGKWRITDEEAKGMLKVLNSIGFTIAKDDLGYYQMIGELVCTAD